MQVQDHSADADPTQFQPCNQLIRLRIAIPGRQHIMHIAQRQAEVIPALTPYLAMECVIGIRHLAMPVDPHRVTIFDRGNYELEVWLDGEQVAMAHRKDADQTLAQARAESPHATFFALPEGVTMYAISAEIVDTKAEGFILTYNEPASPDANILRAMGFTEI